MSLRTTSDASGLDVSQADIEFARTYGVEARLHHFDRDWTEVQPALAQGWQRMRSAAVVPWDVVESEVHAGWRAAEMRGPGCR